MKRLLCSLLVLVGCGVHANAQVLFSSGLEEGTGWTIVADPDTSAEFGFDYSSLGIPAAPGGGDTIGLRMASNITADGPGAAAISAAAPGEFSGQYNVQFDFWLNYHTSAGTTEYGGGGVNFDASGDNPLKSNALLVNTDGDSSTDYLLYQDGTQLGLDSGAYSIDSLDHAADVNMPLRDAFPGGPPPESQNTDFGQVLAPNPDGTFGFGWHTMLIEADTEAGTATYSIDGFEFGTITGDVSGRMALTHWDRFNSVAGNADLAFGAFDNLVVTQIPEPTGLLTITMGTLLLVLGRRRKIR